MNDQALADARRKMLDGGVPAAAVEVFAHYFRQLGDGVSGIIAESEIDPLTSPASLADVEIDPGQEREAFARTVMVKLNGGLGTSMGMTQAKSLLPVRGEFTFLDIVVRQVLAARARHDVRLPLLLMNSFNTRQDTLDALQAYPELPVEGLPLDFLQSREPKLLASDLSPVRWPADPALEWCPPGHGDLYPSLLAEGLLDALLEQGLRYLSVSNADNLGAYPSPRLAGWFAGTGAAIAMEVCRRTPMDRKGGHLAVRRSDGQIVLRESAQTAPQDKESFADIDRHPYFNTNSLWLDVQQVRDHLQAHQGVLGLPMIRNTKTVDPTDPSSPEVIQIETAMGAAIEVFPGSQAIEVPRDRFLPVKTTNELLLVRSDVYELTGDGLLQAQAAPAPVVRLDPAVYARIADFEARFGHGVPSLRKASALTVEGEWTFGPDVTVIGEAHLQGRGFVTGTVGG